jgi:hypothetical protein
MTHPNDPSTPCSYINSDFTVDYSIYQGLTKREYFAAMALQGLLANPNISVVTSDAVLYADRLIAELNQ